MKDSKISYLPFKTRTSFFFKTNQTPFTLRVVRFFRSYFSFQKIRLNSVYMVEATREYCKLQISINGESTPQSDPEPSTYPTPTWRMRHPANALLNALSAQNRISMSQACTFTFGQFIVHSIFRAKNVELTSPRDIFSGSTRERKFLNAFSATCQWRTVRSSRRIP